MLLMQMFGVGVKEKVHFERIPSWVEYELN